MKFVRVSVFTLIALTASAAAEDDESLWQAKHFYRHDCAPCHGPKGQGNDDLKVPAIAGLPDYYIVQEMEKFRKKRRGLDPNDPKLEEMHNDAADLDDATFRWLGKVIARMEPRHDLEGAQYGDAERGSRLFEKLCAECHGLAAQGNPAKQAPPLHGFQAWYLLDQLQKFKAGKRKADPENAASIQMHSMTKRLWRKKDLRDVIAYVTTRLDGEADAEP